MVYYTLEKRVIYKVCLECRPTCTYISANVEHLLLIKTMIQGNCERNVNLPGLSTLQTT